jgi:hypothetical protein
VNRRGQVLSFTRVAVRGGVIHKGLRFGFTGTKLAEPVVIRDDRLRPSSSRDPAPNTAVRDSDRASAGDAERDARTVRSADRRTPQAEPKYLSPTVHRPN